MSSADNLTIRPALPADVEAIAGLVTPYSQDRILLGKDLVDYYESIQEFLVAESAGEVLGCGAIHVMWRDLAEIRTLAVHPNLRGQGVGHRLLLTLMNRARDLGLARLFCLTFEVDFFLRHGFEVAGEEVVDPSTYAQLLLSKDDGVAEFLDLARVKPNTLGNTRMLCTL